MFLTSEWYYIKNWWKFQHYKDRHPPWLKLHRGFFTDPAVQSLSIIDRYHLLELWVAASELEGSLPVATPMLARSCHLASHSQASRLLARLEEKGLISKEDIRGARRVLASKMLAPKTETETYKEETEKKEQKHKPNGFIKPEVSLIESYMTEQGFRDPPTSASKFFNWYESNGWRVGKNPMKSWKNAVITWKHNEKNNGGLFNGTGKLEGCDRTIVNMYSASKAIQMGEEREGRSGIEIGLPGGRDEGDL
jgi:hypothetical protein